MVDRGTMPNLSRSTFWLFFDCQMLHVKVDKEGDIEEKNNMRTKLTKQRDTLWLTGLVQSGLEGGGGGDLPRLPCGIIPRTKLTTAGWNIFQLRLHHRGLVFRWQQHYWKQNTIFFLGWVGFSSWDIKLLKCVPRKRHMFWCWPVLGSRP